MWRALALLLLLATPAAAQTGSAKTTAQLNTEINAVFPDNTTGQITPNVLRQVTLDQVASFGNVSSVNTWALSQTFSAGLTTTTVTASTSVAIPTGLLVVGALTSGPPNLGVTPYFLSGNGVGNFIPVGGQYATYSFMRTVNNTGGGNITNAVGCAHDKTGVAATDIGMWCVYQQGVITAAASVATGPALHVLEEKSWLNAGPASVVGAIDPYRVNATGAHTIEALRIDNGTGNAGGAPSSNAIDAFLHFAWNAGQAQAGIIFDASGGNSSVVLNGGLASAVQFPQNYTIDWYSAFGNKAWRIYSAAASGNNTMVLNATEVTLSANINASSTLLFASIPTIIRNGGTGQLNITSNASTITLSPSSTTILTLSSTAMTYPAATGTPVASLCLDASNNIIKKTTAGSCI